MGIRKPGYNRGANHALLLSQDWLRNPATKSLLANYHKIIRLLFLLGGCCRNTNSELICLSLISSRVGRLFRPLVRSHLGRSFPSSSEGPAPRRRRELDLGRSGSAPEGWICLKFSGGFLGKMMRHWESW